MTGFMKAWMKECMIERLEGWETDRLFESNLIGRLLESLNCNFIARMYMRKQGSLNDWFFSSQFVCMAVNVIGRLKVSRVCVWMKD